MYWRIPMDNVDMQDCLVDKFIFRMHDLNVNTVHYSGAILFGFVRECTVQIL
jgi:hypothetical protein